jgi:hypothetical protein
VLRLVLHRKISAQPFLLIFEVLIYISNSFVAFILFICSYTSPDGTTASEVLQYIYIGLNIGSKYLPRRTRPGKTSGRVANQFT